MRKINLLVILLISQICVFGLKITATYDYKKGSEEYFIIQDSAISKQLAKSYSKYLYEALINHTGLKNKDLKFIEADKNFLRIIIYSFKNINSILHDHSKDYNSDYRYHLVGNIASDSLLNLAVQRLLTIETTEFLLFYHDRINYKKLKSSLDKLEQQALLTKNFFLVTHLIVYYHNLKISTKKETLLQKCKLFSEEEYYEHLVAFLKEYSNKKINGATVIGTIYNW